MLTNTSFHVSNVNRSGLPPNVSDALISIRQEWESVAEGTSLLHYESPVGLLLFDIVAKLDISAEEQRHFLGSVLFDKWLNLWQSKVDSKKGMCRRIPFFHIDLYRMKSYME